VEEARHVAAACAAFFSDQTLASTVVGSGTLSSSRWPDVC